MKLLRTFGLCAALFTSVLSAYAGTNVLISSGSFWSYLDNGSNQGTNWYLPGFNDGAWSFGQAPLGYGGNVSQLRTIVGYGPNSLNKYVTTYFRHLFELGDPEAYTILRMNVKRDDGVAVYLNGVEVFRNNLTNRAVYNSRATNATDNGTVFLTTTVNPLLLIAGDNLVAAEVHTTLANDDDLRFDLELLGSTDPTGNSLPMVAITSPANNSFFIAPPSVTLQANASDFDGTIFKVEFYRNNGIKLGEDTNAPYSLVWANPPVGNHSLYARATDNLAGRSLSSSVNITIGVSAPPVIASVIPPPGSVTNLTQITVNFNEPVTGVQASDLLINGRPAVTLSAGTTNFTFGFPAPQDGTVLVAWNGSHGIEDFEPNPRAFDSFGAGASWQYSLADRTPPAVAAISPATGATVQSLDEVSITFSEPVTGVDRADLIVNGVPASDVRGFGNGPYVFSFPPAPEGTVQMSWAASHGIKDMASTPNNFAGGSWTYTLDSTAVFDGRVIINEIMYHPQSERTSEEYIELRNTGSSAVNLAGWRLNRGVGYDFSNVSITAGGYVVVAANPSAFALKYGSVGTVLGPWEGILSNSGEEIELEDASGNRVDIVAYADEGDWAARRRLGSTGWEWYAEHDGLGKSLELMNSRLDNSVAQNWASSLTPQGTPGGLNSVNANNAPPLISEVEHFPAVPKSTDPITIRARVIDESSSGLTATLRYRDAIGGSFSSAPMFDDGANNDGAASDGVFATVVPAFPALRIIEFYIEATDTTGRMRAWPPQIGDGGVESNPYFQVDNEEYTGRPPLYRLIMRPQDRDEFFFIYDRLPRNATFITVEGSDVEIRYLCDVRRRGASSFSSTPPTFKLNIPRDRLWNGKSSMNMNSVNTWAQVLGSAVAIKAGLPAAHARGVHFRFNGIDQSWADSRMFSRYAAIEVLNDEWAEDFFPNDGEGNVYSKRRPECNFEHRGTDLGQYLACGYDKESNSSENDWSDLVKYLGALDPRITLDSDYVSAVKRNVNVELWMRHFATLYLMHYNETAPVTGDDDDYTLYRGIVDPRFILLPHDLDSIFGSAGLNGHGIYQAGNIPNLNRFLRHPEFEPMYHDEYRRQLAGAFSTNQLFPLIDQVLGDWAPGVIQQVKNEALARRNSVLAQLSPALTAVRATISGEPPSRTYLTTATLRVGGNDVTSYRYRLNNGAFGPETPVATPINLSGLGAGTYAVFVIGRNSQGLWQSTNTPTASKTWTVIPGLAGVVINEVLARNESAVNHFNTFPDMIELYNAGTTAVDLSGMQLTDDPEEPGKFTFPTNTTLAAGAYLRLLADDTNGTSGIHLGFALDQDGEAVYLFDKASNGGRVIDSVEFGNQLPNLSIGRLASGTWSLCTPTLGSANVAAATGNAATLAINEWLADGSFPFVDDFVELYNPDPLPIDLGGFYFTDHPIGQPARHQLTPLHFIAGYSYLAFVADGNQENGALHLNFQLGAQGGEIALFAPDLTLIDCVYYTQQRTGISQGRSPNGSERIVFLEQPTPGAGNPTPPEPLPPVTFIPIDGSFQWRYNESGTDLGTTWKDVGFPDSSWPQAPALLGQVRSGGTPPPEPVRTGLTPAQGKTTFYFRSTFKVPAGLDLIALEIRHIIDDGAIFYINGQEVGRYNMTDTAVTYDTFALGNVLDPSYASPLSVPLSVLVVGTNTMAVEVHQSTPTSGDIMFGLRLEGIRPADPAVVMINEVLANNVSQTGADSTEPDWIELYNPSNGQVDLSGMSLSDRFDDPTRWVFPPGSRIPAFGYFRVNFDSNSATNATNTGFGLKATGDAVYLFNRPSLGGEVLDGVIFGIQAPDFSLARVPNGSDNWVLGLPTLLAPNIAATLGNPARLKINEWFAEQGNDDWFEIHNPEAQPVDISELYLSDRISNLQRFAIPPLSFIGTGLRGFQIFHADDDTGAGANHVNFGLSPTHDFLYISDAQSAILHSVEFFNQAPGVSEGLLPDGNRGVIVRFPSSSTPEESNFLPIEAVVINEVLSHADDPFEDAIELRNLMTTNVNIGGWYLSDSITALRKFRIPDNTIIGPNGFKVFYQNQFNPVPGDPGSFGLSSAHGDEVHLSVADERGLLTGYRGRVLFGPAENGVSFGRFQTSVDVQFVAMQSLTFGKDRPANIADFRTGTGKTNTYAHVGPVVISEIMYHPPDINGFEDNVVDEFVRLRNLEAFPVELFHSAYPTNRWRLRDAVKFEFPPNTTLAATGSVYIVSFDPVAAPLTAAAFRDKFGISTDTPVLGPYEGKLDNSSDSVELVKPDAPEPPSNEGPAVVPYIMVDKVEYSDVDPWPTEPDGMGAALRRINLNLFGNDPANWTAEDPYPGGLDSDSDGMPDSWENLYGLDRLDPDDADLDNDDDGLKNKEEYIAGTIPNDAGSTLRLELVPGSPVVLRLNALPEKSYTIEFVPTPGGLWQPWRHIDADPNPRLLEFPATAGFYRVHTPRAP
jgi:hypothetical protein